MKHFSLTYLYQLQKANMIYSCYRYVHGTADTPKSQTMARHKNGKSTRGYTNIFGTHTQPQTSNSNGVGHYLGPL